MSGTIYDKFAKNDYLPTIQGTSSGNGIYLIRKRNIPNYMFILLIIKILQPTAILTKSIFRIFLQLLGHFPCTMGCLVGLIWPILADRRQA